MAKSKRYVVSGQPAEFVVPEPDSDEKRAASRERIARGKTAKSRKVSKDPRIADSKRDRWKSKARADKAASEGREVGRYE